MTTGAENAGRVDSYKRAEEMGIEVQQEWMATLDGRTRDSHRILDGERIPVAKDKWHPAKFSNKCRYPGDPDGPPQEVYNCRCTLVPVIKGVDQSKAPRNSKLGGMSYEEWKRGHTKKQTTVSDDRRLSGIRKTLGDEFVDVMQTLLEFTDEPYVKDLFYKYGDRISVVADGKKRSAYFSPRDGSVHMDPQYVSSGDTISRPYQTAFHEFAHNIDWLAGSEAGGKWASVGYSSGKLARTIKSDWENFKISEFKKDPLKYMRGSTEEEKMRYFRTMLRGGATSKNYELFSDLAHKMRNGEITIEDVLNNPKYGDAAARAVMKFTFGDDEALDLIKESAGGTIDKIAMGNVSDAVEFCTRIPYPLGIGHGKSYWNAENGALEFFAEVCDGKAANPASMEQMRKYFPNAVKIVEEIMEALIK